MRHLATSVLVCVILLAGIAIGLGSYAPRHHLPQQQMEDADRRGNGCLLFLGDSRMVAALDAGALHQELRLDGNDRCHVQLAVGATDVGGMYLTAREYLSRGHVPRAVVIGEVGDSLLGLGPARPEAMTGNNAIHLVWSRFNDVFTEIPGFPTNGIGAFDAGFRFLLARATPLGRYQSLASIRIQRLEALMTGERGAPQNTFGGLDDMAKLEETLRARARNDLAEVMGGSDDVRLGRWFGPLLELMRRHGVVPVVVELPMRASYRMAVTATPEAASYRRWLAQQLTNRGGSFLDLSSASWVADQLFVDELHLGPAGAALVSRAIARHLAATVR